MAGVADPLTERRRTGSLWRWLLRGRNGPAFSDGPGRATSAGSWRRSGGPRVTERTPVAGTGFHEASRRTASNKIESERRVGTRGHNWSRDELILALDLYSREPSARTRRTHPEVQQLCELLNNYPIHPAHDDSTYKRNVNAVHMKIGNFFRFDPEYPGVGLRGGSKLEREVWQEFWSDRATLHRVAESIRQLARSSDVLSGRGEGYSEPEAAEGRLLTRLHRVRERAPKLVRQKKEKVLETHGRLACEACGFDFERSYGDRGKGFAECHHRIPLAELSVSRRTRLRDLAIVCANCHRMIHRARPWLTVRQIRDMVRPD